MSHMISQPGTGATLLVIDEYGTPSFRVNPEEALRLCAYEMRPIVAMAREAMAKSNHPKIAEQVRQWNKTLWAENKRLEAEVVDYQRVNAAMAAEGAF